ncbi:hypothetical protein Pr1d_13720 [Bythopirellula goksoeyrii]|uniref:Uncharacterized protein n=1 Tax=Bythopirellula goksoeyrii TaxID=1400387 RepID=A0A5B9Q8U4_9BACT|nr:hypothetical protein Pr1d_13720 [Bythopirellula goksoeyrii]
MGQSPPDRFELANVNSRPYQLSEFRPFFSYEEGLAQV